MREIIFRTFYIVAFFEIPEIFERKRFGIIFGMPRDKNYLQIFRCRPENACILGNGKQIEVFAVYDIFLINFCVTGMRSEKFFGKPLAERIFGAENFMLKNSEHLFGKRMLLNAAVMH